MEDTQSPTGQVVDAGTRILEALAHDRYGIAYAKLFNVNPQVKPLALATVSGAPVEPTKENVQRRSYPLSRSMMVYLNHDPAKSVDPKLKEFLRYVLSAEGQQAVVREGGYFPLAWNLAREQARKL